MGSYCDLPGRKINLAYYAGRQNLEGIVISEE
jgi:hypothetical protein